MICEVGERAGERDGDGRYAVGADVIDFAPLFCLQVDGRHLAGWDADDAEGGDVGWHWAISLLLIIL